MLNYFNNIKNYNSHYFTSLRKLEEIKVRKIFNKHLKETLTLEVGSGNGYYSSVIQEYIGFDNSLHLDFAEHLLKQIKGNTVCADYKTNPFGKETFEQIICLGAVEFIGKDFFKVTHELLKDKGQCIICIPQKNLIGLIYSLFYKRKNIQLYFYDDQLINDISKLFNIKHNSSFLLNRYLILEKQ